MKRVGLFVFALLLGFVVFQLALAPADAAEGRYPRGRLGTHEKWVLVDLSQRPQTLYCFEGERVVDAYPCSGSRFGTSDRGWAVAGKKRAKQWYRGSADSGGYWMRWWTTILPDTRSGASTAAQRGWNGFHACPPNGTDDIGSPASHGCIRLPQNRAKAFWNWLDGGVPVYLAVDRAAPPRYLLSQLRGRQRRPNRDSTARYSQGRLGGA
jgi:hypothetical protein